MGAEGFGSMRNLMSFPGNLSFTCLSFAENSGPVKSGHHLVILQSFNLSFVLPQRRRGKDQFNLCCLENLLGVSLQDPEFFFFITFMYYFAKENFTRGSFHPTASDDRNNVGMFFAYLQGYHRVEFPSF